MGIDRIGKNGPPVAAPGSRGAGGRRRPEARLPGTGARRPRRAASAASTQRRRDAGGRHAPSSVFAPARSTSAGYVDQKVHEATAHLSALPPVELESDSRGALRDRLASDPALVELLHTATGETLPARRRLTWPPSSAAGRWCWVSRRRSPARAASGSRAAVASLARLAQRPAPAVGPRAAALGAGPRRGGRAHLGRARRPLSRRRRPSRARRGDEVAGRGGPGLAARLRAGPRVRPPARAPSSRRRLRRARRARPDGATRTRRWPSAPSAASSSSARGCRTCARRPTADVDRLRALRARRAPPARPAGDAGARGAARRPASTGSRWAASSRCASA